MSRHRTIVLIAVYVLSTGFLLSFADESKASEEATLWTQIVKLYEQAKGSGETATEDVYEWAKSDLETIGDWEYKVAYFPNANHIALEKRLNELGTERWEVVWIDRQGPNLIVTMKRPSRTWLNQLPLGQLLKLAAPGGGDGGE
jgi:hypothetical protein